jgi:putative phosphonate transport system ATP-binding protein
VRGIDMLIEVKEVSKIFGNSCGRCKKFTGVNYNTSKCPYCNSIVAVNKVNFSLRDGQSLGIVGESGSGKSTLLNILYLLENPDEGSMFLYEDNMSSPKNAFCFNLLEQSRYRNSFASIIFQKVERGLNFHFSAGANVAERIIGFGNRRFNDIKKQVLELLSQTEIDISRSKDLPMKFSGGQQQRIQIAKALANSPRLLLLDEPTTGLDVSIQAKIIDLIKELRDKFKFSMILVSHDLNVIKHLTEITAVMKNGEIVEKGLTDQILEDPQHPYTQLLISSML